MNVHTTDAPSTWFDYQVPDNGLLKLGNDSDGVLLLRSATLNANTALTSVLVGTPVTPALPTNSVILSNITASGDILLATNKGGNSIAGLWLDGSTGDTALLAASGASIDHYIAGTKVLDHSAGAFAFQETTTISSTGTLTINAFTAGGNITLGANSLIGTNMLLKENTSNYGWESRNAADTATNPMQCSVLYFTAGLQARSSGLYLNVSSVDNHYFFFTAQDNGVGLVEIARLQGAADPYIRIGRDDTGVALSSVTDMLVLQAGGGTGNEAAGFGLGISLKIGNAASQVEERGSLDLVLQTATDASEDASWIFQAMVAGSMATVLSVGGYAGVAKLGFYATAPVALQTGVAVSAAGIHAALVNLGLITS